MLTRSHCILKSFSFFLADWEFNTSASTWQLFQEMYPNEEKFPETTPPENSEDDIELTLET
jgi:hypothetical protein